MDEEERKGAYNGDVVAAMTPMLKFWTQNKAGSERR